MSGKRSCTKASLTYMCTECGAFWGGYHSGTFCLLKKLSDEHRLGVPPIRIARAAMIFDNRENDERANP